MKSRHGCDAPHRALRRADGAKCRAEHFTKCRAEHVTKCHAHTVSRVRVAFREPPRFVVTSPSRNAVSACRDGTVAPCAPAALVLAARSLGLGSTRTGLEIQGHTDSGPARPRARRVTRRGGACRPGTAVSGDAAPHPPGVTTTGPPES